MKTQHFLELSGDQRRQLVDAESLFDAFETTSDEAFKHRGSMFWREQDGRKYLIKLSADSKQQSLGRESPETIRTFERFTTRKEAVEQRLADLKAQLKTTKRVNSALRVGRAPDTLVEIVQRLAKARVADHFLVVGTNALYAYETAAGVRFPNDVMETRAADFLYDTANRADFLQVMDSNGLSFMDLLRKADKTFERHPHDNCTAVNSRGYEVDLISRFPPPDADEHPLQMTPHGDDLWAVCAPTAAPRFSQVIVSASGAMARMVTAHPLHFARIKRELAMDAQRDPRKAKKDAEQADLVEQLVKEYLPHLLDERAESTPRP